MSFNRSFPYATGSFVIIGKEEIEKDIDLLCRVGSIACYNCVTEDDEMIVVISGYKDAWCGEYLVDDFRLATQDEIEIYKRIKGIR